MVGMQSARDGDAHRFVCPWNYVSRTLIRAPPISFPSLLSSREVCYSTGFSQCVSQNCP